MKSAKIEMAPKTRQVVLNQLRLDNINDVILKKYSPLDRDHDINKSDARIYLKRITGSVRLQNERYYTINEFSDRIDKIKKYKLP